MSPLMILDALTELGFQLSVRADKLVVSTSQEAIGEELLAFLRGHKAGLVAEILAREAMSSAGEEPSPSLHPIWRPDPDLVGWWICYDAHGLAMEWQNYAPDDPPCECE